MALEHGLNVYNENYMIQKHLQEHFHLSDV